MIHIILISTIILSYACRKHQALQKLPFIVLAFISSIRYMYGNDYTSYHRCFELIKSGSGNPFEEELLYSALNKLLPSFYILIVVTSIFFIHVIHMLIKINIESKYIWISVFIFLINPYLFLMNLSAIRQCIAMCFFILAVEMAIKKKIWGYFGCLIVAILFHKSAMILLPIIFLITNQKVNVKKIVIIMLGMILLLSYDDLTSVINNILGYFEFTSYSSYISDGIGNSIRATILSSCYFIYVLFNMPKMEGKYLVYGKLYLYGTMLSVLAYRISMLTRVQMYFDIFSIIVIPYLFTRRPMNGKLTIYAKSSETIYEVFNRYFLPCIIIIIYCLRYYSFFNNTLWESFYKYRTILDLL